MGIALLVALILAEIAVIATSVYLHRGLAHRALRLHPVTDGCFRTLLWLTTGQSRREWVAVHRKHHAFTDRVGDPHSPRLFGFWHIQLWNVYYYAREARNPDTSRTFAPDIVEDWLDRAVFSRGVTGLALGIGLLCLVFGVKVGLAAGLVHAVLYVFVLAPLEGTMNEQIVRMGRPAHALMRVAATGIYLLRGVRLELPRAARGRAVIDGTTLHQVRLEGLGEYAAGTWTPRAGDKRSAA